MCWLSWYSICKHSLSDFDFALLINFIDTGLVPKLPSAILSVSLMLLSFLSLISGLILDSLSRARHEVKRLNYLSYKSPRAK